MQRRVACSIQELNQLVLLLHSLLYTSTYNHTMMLLGPVLPHNLCGLSTAPDTCCNRINFMTKYLLETADDTNGRPNESAVVAFLEICGNELCVLLKRCVVSAKVDTHLNRLPDERDESHPEMLP